MSPPKLNKRPRINFISNPLIKKEEKNVVKKKAKKKKRESLSKKKERGVVYFSHIPHGFYEEQIRDYCSQFGKVTGLYLPRSKRGNSRGYGFVEFQYPEVAEVVADTMNNYLMFNRLLKASYIPPSQQRPGVIKRAKYWDNKAVAIKQREDTLHCMTRTLTPEEEEKQTNKIKKSIKNYHKKLQAMGLDYEFKVEDNDLDSSSTEKRKEDS